MTHTKPERDTTGDECDPWTDDSDESRIRHEPDCEPVFVYDPRTWPDPRCPTRS